MYHKKTTTILKFMLSGLVAVMATPAMAAEPSAPGTTLTVVGAEKAGSQDGNIPAWAAEKQESGDWNAKKPRGEFWKYKGEQAKFSIDANNVEKYATHLTPGQVAALKQIKGFRLDVYPTHRSCGVPDFVAENTRKNQDVAQLGADGWTLKDAVVPGIPFPQPKSGIEAIWNQRLHYRGVGVTFPNGITKVSPHKGGSEWIDAGYEQTYYWPWAAKGSHKFSEIGAIFTQTYFTYLYPVAMAGQAGIVTDFINQPGTESFYYFPGQRRVRRLPSYAYDSPQIGFENQYAMDETQVYMGSPDRFDWKVLGKKEIYVPYNSFGAYDINANKETVFTRDFIEPGHRRYEQHRVWVIEGNVKAGVRHTSPKRVLYLDEDSWNVVFAEDYDAQGKLWKIREGYLIPVYETGSCDVAAFSQYNLAEGRYLTDFHAIGTKVGPQWTTEANSARLKSSFYTADNLRAISDR